MIISINCERQRVEKIEKDMEKCESVHNFVCVRTRFGDWNENRGSSAWRDQGA